MKKFQVTLGLLVLLGLVFLLPSCNKDGDWSNTNNEDIYGFAIERDVEFAEKALKEVTHIMFNIKANYDFDKIPMKFKVFYKSGAGTLTLNGVVIENNSTYKLKKKDNIFEYVGTKEGKNSFVITVTNDKNVSKEEEFNINYAITDFSVESKPVNPNQTVWQGDEYSYMVKIEPSNPNKPTNDYQIMFDVYDGNIKIEGREVEKRVWHRITGDIGNIGVTMSTNTHGNAILRFKIKNNTTERDGFNITQKIEQRIIEVKNLSISDTSFVINSRDHKIWGNIIKTPQNNNKIFYKTWLKAPAGYTGGIDVVKEYQEYALADNGDFNIKFNITDKATIGTYSFLIQFKDEYDNESVVKEFQFKITGGNLVWIQEPTMFVRFERWEAGAFKQYRDFALANFDKTFEIYTGNDKVYINTIKYSIYFEYTIVMSDGQRFNRLEWLNTDGRDSKFNEVMPNQTTTIKYYKELHDFANINYKTWARHVYIKSAEIIMSIQLSNNQTIIKKCKTFFEINGPD